MKLMSLKQGMSQPRFCLSAEATVEKKYRGLADKVLRAFVKPKPHGLYVVGSCRGESTLFPLIKRCRIQGELERGHRYKPGRTSYLFSTGKAGNE
jgi:hypothetical protein